jgi:hypothetical protein
VSSDDKEESVSAPELKKGKSIKFISSISDFFVDLPLVIIFPLVIILDM